MPKSPVPDTPRKRGRPPKLPSDLDEGNRRRQLIEGAARLFRAKGFDGTSTRDIAAAAGMRSGSPFYHFDSKNALLYVVVQEGMAFAYQSQCDALTKLSEGASPREQLRSLVRAARRDAAGLAPEARQPRSYRELFLFIKPLMHPA